MKKALLLLALSTSITSAAFADGHHKSHHSKPVEKNGYYLRADLGTSSAQKLNDGDVYENNEVKRANVYSLGIGKYLTNKFRADLSASIRNYKLNGNNTSNMNQKIQSLALMISGYYDIATVGRFTPYLSAGVGLANNKAGTLTASNSNGGSSYTTSLAKKSTNNLAWQVGAGSAIKLTDKIDMDLSYKFMDMGKVKTGSGSVIHSAGSGSVIHSGGITDPATAGNAKLGAHEFSIGARYNF